MVEFIEERTTIPVNQATERSETSADSSNAAEEGRSSTTMTTTRVSSLPWSSRNSSSFASSVRDAIVGTRQTFRLGKDEVREKRHQVTYEPTHRWWEPSLSSWLPEYNREISLLLFLYNAAIPILAEFTSFCGEHTEKDVAIHSFCSDDYLLLEDKVLSGFAVGMFLLLAFRSRQAYDRWWEGRKNWGRMREVSRDFARLVCSYVDSETEDDWQDRRRAIDFVTAFGAATKLHLRKERDIRRDIVALGCGLSCQDVANIQQASHMPLFCLDIMSDYLSKQVKAGKLSDYQMGVINSSSLAVMSDKLGSCERLANTPIPLSYVLQLRFFMILWLILYPLHVIPYYGWWSILLTCLVAYAVLGIESMACEIENPFGYSRNDLDLDVHVQGFYKDTQEILRRREHDDKDKIFDRKQVLKLSGRFTEEETQK